MRTMGILIALLASTAALAQSAPSEPPMVGDRPLVQVKPRGGKMATDAKPAARTAAKPAPKPEAEPEAAPDAASEPAPDAAAAKPAKGAKSDTKAGAKSAKPAGKQSIAVRLQACLEIEDGSKGRLDCYDAIFKPAPKSTKPGAKQPPAKGVADCRFAKEEDERLACFNGFAESIPKLPKT